MEVPGRAWGGVAGPGAVASGAAYRSSQVRQRSADGEPPLEIIERFLSHLRQRFSAILPAVRHAEARPR